MLVYFKVASDMLQEMFFKITLPYQLPSGVQRSEQICMYPSASSSL